MPFFDAPPLKTDGTTPIYRQLYDYLRGAILSGQLRRGTRLPSTRALADELGVSRNTVLNAYDQLFAEGYLESIGGNGTFVTNTLPDMLLRSAETRRSPAPDKRPHRVSAHVDALQTTPAMPSAPVQRRPGNAFETGTPALDEFPYTLWARLISRHANALHPGIMAYQHVAGYAPLRQAIADHVLLARQVRCSPEQVIIVSGSQSALYLAARVLLNDGDEAWLEDPGYHGARRAIVAAGGRPVPVPVDSDGIDVAAGIARAPHARMAYLTPSHQFPMGVTLNLRRRLDILAWANASGAYLLEDDYDSEFRYAGRPLASLQGLDDGGSVIYIGTFSKVLFPSLRLGYLIVPPGLVDAFLSYHASTDYHLPILEQAALADFITGGHFTRHIRRMRGIYAARRAALIDALRGLPLALDAPDTGMHLVGWLPEGVSDQRVSQRANELGARVLPVSLFAVRDDLPGGLILGFSGTTEADIQRGVEQLRQAIDDVMENRL